MGTPDGTYVPLHVHFEASALDGAVRYSQIKDIKEQRRCPAVAMTDHGNLSGVPEFVMECRKQGIKPIVGLESYWAFNRKLKTGDELGNARPNYHMLLYAVNNNGLKNLNRINSVSWEDGFYFSPRADNELLATYMQDIIGTSACLGSVTSQLILKGEYEKAFYWLSYFKELFHGKFFLELQPHVDMEEQLVVNQWLVDASKRLDLPMIVTGDSHYFDCCDSVYHDHLLAKSMNKQLDDPNRMRFTWDASISTYFDMVDRCARSHVPEEAIANTHLVASMITDNYFSDRMNRWPSYKKLPPGVTSFDYIWELCRQGYKKLYSGKTEIDEAHYERIVEELRVLKIMGYIDYMLILADICRFSRDNKILYGMGRGSAAGSYVAYLLGIVQVDPFKYDLLFSRFCNEGRAATPVIFDEDMGL